MFEKVKKYLVKKILTNNEVQFALLNISQLIGNR